MPVASASSGLTVSFEASEQCKIVDNEVALEPSRDSGVRVQQKVAVGLSKCRPSDANLPTPKATSPCGR